VLVRATEDIWILQEREHVVGVSIASVGFSQENMQDFQ
jgi:hypothetical protein